MNNESQKKSYLLERIKQLEEDNYQLAIQAERALKVRDLDQKLQYAESTQEMHNIVVEHIAENSDATCCVFYFADLENEFLQFSACHGLVDDINPVSDQIAIDDDLLMLIGNEKRVCSSQENYSDLQKLVKYGNEDFCFCLMPVSLGGQLHGVTLLAGKAVSEDRMQSDLLVAQVAIAHLETHLYIYYERQRLESQVDQRTIELERDIELRRQMEKNLEENQARLSDLIFCSSDSIWEIDLNGVFTYVSDNVRDMLGYFPNELVGSEIFSLLSEQYYEEFQELLQSAISLESAIRDQVIQLRSRRGKHVWVEINAIPFYEDGAELQGFRGVAKDITARIEIEQDLLKSQQRLYLHVEQTPLAVIEWDLDFHVAAWNPGAERIFGYTEHEALGKHPAEIILAPEVRDVVNRVWRDILDQQDGTRSQNENLTASGKVIICDWYNTPLVNEKGKVVGVASLVQDITDQVKHEKMLKEAKEEADRANKAKSVFLANMSHELRTPLHGILGFAQFGFMRSEEVDKSRLKGYFEKILGSGQRLKMLLDDLLDLSKLDSAMMVMDYRVSNLARVLEECVSEQKAFADEKNTAINIVIQEGVPEVECDPLRIGQVVLNLLSNAIKYSESNSKIDIVLKKENRSVRLEVKDRGRGIPDDELESIFDKFIQSSNTTIKDGGTGLGLAITREIIELHNGKVWAENRAGGGTSFIVCIPLQHL